MSSILMDEAIDQWNSLVEREDIYKVHPPLLLAKEEEHHDHHRQSSDDDDDDVDRHSTTSFHTTATCPPVWREKICEWCFQVVDHCDIDRDVVSIAASYFDRYLSCARGGGSCASIAEKLYQLVAMTSLYLAVKIHSSRKISVSSMSSLSKGHFRIDQILKMEISIIRSLNWHLNPPTPSIFLHAATPLIDAATANDSEASFRISELSRYLLELSVCDAYFVDKSPSAIARASIAVAVENSSSNCSSSSSSLYSKIERQRRFDRILQPLNDKSPDETERCARRLQNVYSAAMFSLEEDDDDHDEGRAGSSPTSALLGH